MSTPSRVEPQTPDEREALALLRTTPPGPSVVMLAESTLRLDAVYRSATGYPCRGFVLERETTAEPPHRRLACLDGTAWFLVPDLLEDGTMDGSLNGSEDVR